MQSSPTIDDKPLNEGAVQPPIFYFGQSMKGTLREGDSLTIAPASLSDIVPGDVIVFRRPQPAGSSQPYYVVHRVTAIVPGGIMMRGDFNLQHDVQVVREANVIGRVTHLDRAGKVRVVRNGRRGLWRAKTLHAWYALRRAVWRLTLSVGRTPYRRFKKSGLILRFWHPSISTISLQTEEGTLIKYVCNGRTVACWWRDSNRFTIVRPYDLIIPQPNETSGEDHQS